MTLHLTPLAVLKRLIGSESVIAGICGVSDKAPYHWNRPAKGRPAGDLPGTPHQRKLLAHSKRHRLGLKARHLIEGASEREVAAILSERPAPPVTSSQDRPTEAA